VDAPIVEGAQAREAYAYVLGLYLGDGYLVRFPRAWCLRILFDMRYPGLIAEVEAALQTVLPRNKVWSAARTGMNCVVVGCYSTRWPVLLPQHGPGRKHGRPSVLADWQSTLTSEHTQPFLRGLIHSDGSRFLNRIRTAKREYVYPNYAFTNVSADIRGIFCHHLDLLGIAWRPAGRRNIAIARREAVAALDAFVGPKA
jgi:hypothetical protein